MGRSGRQWKSSKRKEQLVRGHGVGQHIEVVPGWREKARKDLAKQRSVDGDRRGDSFWLGLPRAGFTAAAGATLGADAALRAKPVAYTWTGDNQW